MRSSFLRIALAVAAWTLICDASQAEEQKAAHDWLKWSAPPECPPSDHIEVQLKRWLGEAFRPEESKLRAEASVEWVEERWAVELRLRRGSDESTRHVIVATCSEAADFVAVSVALLENPELSVATEGEETTAPPERTLDSQESDTKPPLSDEEVEPALAPGPEEKTEEPERSGSSLPLALDVGGGVSIGPLPRPAGVAFGRLSLRPGPWRLGAGLEWAPRVQYTPAEAKNAAIFGFLTSQLQACRLFIFGDFGVGPCLGVELGGLSGKEKGAQGSTLFWAAAEVLGQAEVAWGWGAVFLELGAQIPFTKPEFVLEGGTLVHQSVSGFQGRVGFSIFL